MTSIPETGFLRLSQILGNPKSNPPTPPIIPISSSSWWDGVNKGRYPKRLKLSPKVTVWRADDIRGLISKTSNEPR